MRITRSVRFNPEALAKAEALDLPVSKICREALDKALDPRGPFTFEELGLIEVALRLRAESCEDNGETKKAEKWRRISQKFQKHFRGQ